MAAWFPINPGPAHLAGLDSALPRLPFFVAGGSQPSGRRAEDEEGGGWNDRSRGWYSVARRIISGEDGSVFPLGIGWPQNPGVTRTLARMFGRVTVLPANDPRFQVEDFLY